MVIKEVKRLVLRPLKTVVRGVESCVDFIILLPDYPIDSPFIFTSTSPLFLPRSRFVLYCSLLYFLYFTIITHFFLVLYNINRWVEKSWVALFLVLFFVLVRFCFLIIKKHLEILPINYLPPTFFLFSQ